MRLKTITKRVQALTGKRGLHDDLAYRVHDMFYSAIQNAEDTAVENPEFTEKDYDQCVLNSLEVRLGASNEPDVQAWYRKQGFSW